MRKALALVLLMIPLRPLVAAGICLHAEIQSEEHCGMPVPGATPDSEPLHHPADSGCTLMAFCAPAAPVIPQDAVLLGPASHPNSTEYPSPALLVAGDPIAPLKPPPIA